MSSLYEYLFSQDSLIIKYNNLDVVVTPGMPVHVNSKRLQTWCTDGIVKSIYKSGINVSYGHSHYFGMFSRGNSKFILLPNITTELRFPSPRCVKKVDRQDLVESREGSSDASP
jgi:hypothetical protein